jgi:chromosome condensin MukBEF ATPase and DNA-binding subunit MukB
MTVPNTTNHGSETAAGDQTERTVADIVADIERRSADQSHDLDLLRQQVEAVMADKEEIAARLGEAVNVLAETRAALESETQMRKQAETKVGTLKSAMAAARAALDVTIDGDPNGPGDGARRWRRQFRWAPGGDRDC